MDITDAETIGGAIYETSAQIAQDDEQSGTFTLHADRYRRLGRAALDAIVKLKQRAFVDQTTFYDPMVPTNGNCQQAVIASFLGLPLSDVPNFLDSADTFTVDYRNFLKERGFTAIQLNPRHKPRMNYLAYGRSDRECSHACIYNAGELVHDPHPNRSGLQSVDCIELIVPTDLMEILAERGRI